MLTPPSYLVGKVQLAADLEKKLLLSPDEYASVFKFTTTELTSFQDQEGYETGFVTAKLNDKNIELFNKLKHGYNGLVGAYLGESIDKHKFRTRQGEFFLVFQYSNEVKDYARELNVGPEDVFDWIFIYQVIEGAKSLFF